MAAARYVKARIFIGAALTASVIGGSAFFVRASPEYSATTERTAGEPAATATLPIIPSGPANTATAPETPTSAPVKPKATATAKRSRAS